MYLKRNYPLKTMLSWTVSSIISFFFIALVPVILFDFFDWKWLTLPWLPIGLVGTALVFITGFKNNAAYDRAWEARQIYGAITNSSRRFVLLMNDYITPEYAKSPVEEEELFLIRKKIAHYHIAWLTCLRHALRKPTQWEKAQHITKAELNFQKEFKVHELTHTVEEDLNPHLAPEDFDYVVKKSNKATACLKLQSSYLKELKFKGYTGHFRHIEMEKAVGEFLESQGRAERIKNFPYPRQFATLSLFLLWIFAILLPFGIMSEFERIGKALTVEGSNDSFVFFLHQHFVWLTVPFSMVVSWIFYTIERTGDVTENPFMGLANDIPITTISRAIEIEMLELIGENAEHIPKPIQPRFDIAM